MLDMERYTTGCPAYYPATIGWCPGAVVVVVVVVVAVVVVVVMVVMVTTTVQWSICKPAPRSQDFLTGSRLGPAELFTASLKLGEKYFYRQTCGQSQRGENNI